MILPVNAYCQNISFTCPHAPKPKHILFHISLRHRAAAKARTVWSGLLPGDNKPSNKTARKRNATAFSAISSSCQFSKWVGINRQNYVYNLMCSTQGTCKHICMHCMYARMKHHFCIVQNVQKCTRIPLFSAQSEPHSFSAAGGSISTCMLPISDVPISCLYLHVTHNVHIKQDSKSPAGCVRKIIVDHFNGPV